MTDTQKIDMLEQEVRRLRMDLACRENSITDLRPGMYILTPDGEFNGGPGATLRDMRISLPDYAAEGTHAVVVEVHEVQPAIADEGYHDWCSYYGLEPGADFPATLAPAV